MTRLKVATPAEMVAIIRAGMLAESAIEDPYPA
jgi:hypothetical protein